MISGGVSISGEASIVAQSGKSSPNVEDGGVPHEASPSGPDSGASPSRHKRFTFIHVGRNLWILVRSSYYCMSLLLLETQALGVTALGFATTLFLSSPSKVTTPQDAHKQ